MSTGSKIINQMQPQMGGYSASSVESDSPGIGPLSGVDGGGDAGSGVQYNEKAASVGGPVDRGVGGPSLGGPALGVAPTDPTRSMY